MTCKYVPKGVEYYIAIAAGPELDYIGRELDAPSRAPGEADEAFRRSLRDHWAEQKTVEYYIASGRS